MAPFDPRHLTPQISLNRVRLIDLPGLAVDAEAQNKTGYELISLFALSRLIREHAAVLQLDPGSADYALRPAIEGCLNSPVPAVRATAEAIGRRLGRNLGYLLLTLKRGDAVNRAARAEWDDSYWAYWGAIRQVKLGGGLVSGELGAHIHRHAARVIERAGVTDLRVDISDFAAHLPLVGTARCAPAKVSAALVFDFGGTLVKRAVVHYRQGKPAVMRLLPVVEIGWQAIFAAQTDPEAQAVHLFERMLTIITQTQQQTGDSVAATTVLIALACYLKNGQPQAAQTGVYTPLRRISANLQQLLAQALSNRAGQTVAVKLLHDGTAAAIAYAGEERTAVITIGTALGVGFPPPARGIRPLGAEFKG